MSRAWDGWEKDASDNGSSRGEGAASHRARVESAEEARVRVVSGGWLKVMAEARVVTQLEVTKCRFRRFGGAKQQ
ncbi:unnamed protein product [Lampetra planeri]